ncbi:MAG TPA: protein phosphatase CheZ [Stellaceae bacterium]|nr:protein phosphatase CheZ [Stellaceae bacterium]
MAKSAANRALEHKLEQIGGSAPGLQPEDIATVVEAVMQSLSGDVSLAEFRLYRELENLADYIQSAKREIAAIRPDDIRHRDIPMATDELDAVVGATADATGAILDAAELLEGMADSIGGGEEVRAIATRIYEACNFQDITGQRITKVVRTLKHIEAKIDALLTTFGELKSAAPSSPEPREALPPDDERNLLHGPQLPDEAKRQDEIDAIFANLK